MTHLSFSKSGSISIFFIKILTKFIRETFNLIRYAKKSVPNYFCSPYNFAKRLSYFFVYRFEMWIPNLNFRSLIESRAGVSRKVLFSSSPVAFWGAIFHMIFIWCRQKSTAAAFLEIVVFIIICPHLTMTHLVLKSIIFSSIPLMHGVGTFIWTNILRCRTG